MMKYKIPLALGASIAVFSAFFYLLTLPLRPSGAVLDASWQVEAGHGEPDLVRLPFLAPLEQGQDVVLLTRFPAVQGDTLVIPRPSGNALQVWLNGDLIYFMGDPNKPTANLWNSLLVVPLPQALRAENDLRIHIWGVSYDTGLTLPPYIDFYAAVLPKAVLAEILFHDLLLISIGASIIVGLILIALSFHRKPGFSAELFFGLASVFAGVYCFDFVFRITSGNLQTFLLVKKTLMAAGYLAALSFVAGLEQFARGRLRFARMMSIPTLLGVIAVAAAWNLAVLASLIPYLNLVLLVNILIAIAIILKDLRTRTVLLIPAFLLIFSLAQMIALTVLAISYPFVLQYVMLVSALVFGVNMILEYNQLFSENKRLVQMATRDPLTGAYNRNIFERLNPRGFDILILLDLNNLKQYNDRYGHPQGDQLLVALTETIQANLRQNDLVIRYGGDEFVLILSAASEEDGERIMKRIRAQFAAQCREDWLGFSYGIALIEGSIAHSLAVADRRMYALKGRKTLPPEVAPADL